MWGALSAERIARRAPSARSCSALARISEDFREMVAESCPRCQGDGGACLVEQMLAALDEAPEAGGPTD